MLSHSKLIIQSFDDGYKFYGSVQEIGRQIGNAVPVLLAQRIGEYILREHEKSSQCHNKKKVNP